MRWRLILYVVGLLTLFFGLTMATPLGVSLYFRDGSGMPMLISLTITLFFGTAMTLGFRGVQIADIRQREGMAIVFFGWTAMGLFGALPFFLAGEGVSFTDAFFESVSGFTTTGASIFTNIEQHAEGILFWRSFIQWLGGMGIIVLSLAVLPLLKVGGMQLYKAEVPTPVPDKLKPRIQETALTLWKVYILFTFLQVLLLLAGGMNLYEAVCHTFTTMPTGGFSTKNASIAHYDSAYFDSVFILFMLMAGINFSLHYQMLKGKPLAIWRDAEGRFFLFLSLLLVLLVSWNIYGEVYHTMGEAIRYGAFQVVSILTTTGFATADYETWPAMSQTILFLCMFIGASAGSTGGGVKCLRIMLLFKYCTRELFLLVHPRSITHIKINGKPIPEEIIRSVIGFLALYIGLFAICTVILSGLGVDFMTSLTAVASCIGNIGPGFGMVGPAENYAVIPSLGKWLLIWCMLLGRLEIYTVIILLAPEFWRK
ncbi:MAG: TrkH family potassium uptake protein [Desulfobacterales bacterium]|nr:TrkH family potassium uptake protein [Desulfobacterales bacterium]MDX2511967.1 TrkH family potassium uptake protein [Desulfobacterales bacterium]